MARMTQTEREQALADFHTGQFSARDLAERYGVNHTTIVRLVKGAKPKNKKAVEKIAKNLAVELAAQTSQIKKITPIEARAVEQAASQRAWYIREFETRAWRNQEKADEMLECAEDMSEVEAHSRITQRNKETILGKEPSVKIENENNQNNQTVIAIKRETINARS